MPIGSAPESFRKSNRGFFELPRLRDEPSMVGGHQLLIAASDILQAGIVGKSFRFPGLGTAAAIVVFRIVTLARGM